MSLSINIGVYMSRLLSLHIAKPSVLMAIIERIHKYMIIYIALLLNNGCFSYPNTQDFEVCTDPLSGSILSIVQE